MIDRPCKVCVVGTGHIGLPLAALLAEVGFEVTGYDTNDDFVTHVNTTGSTDFREEGLDELLAKHLHKGLTLTSSPPAGQDVYIITVGTPLETGMQRPNLERVRMAVQRIAPGFGENPLIVLRSTVSIGTTRSVVLPEITRAARRFGLAFCPERTIEGKAIPEMRSLPQIVGGLDDESADRAEALFRLITPKIVRVSSLETAEMIKLINNTYRDLTFAFANEVALIAERMGLSAAEMIHAANVDYARSNVAQPGFVGGPCLRGRSTMPCPITWPRASLMSCAAFAAPRPAPRSSSRDSPSRGGRPRKTSADRRPSPSCAGCSPPASRSGGTTS